jgi:hypothetical protein
MNKVLQFAGASLLVCAALVGCKSDDKGSSARSAIVQQVEAAGAGDLDNATEPMIRGWLGGHLPVTKQIGPACSVAAKTATANWQATTEGRVCTAAAQVLFYAPKQLYNGDYTKH